MAKPDDLIGREREWDELERIAASPRGELVFMHGRRRVGKSWLLQRFAEASDGLYLQASRGTRQDQLRRLSTALGDRFDDAALRAGVAFDTWDALLDYLTTKAGERMVIIDEFPYLSAESGDLTSVIQSFWDSRWKRGAFKLVLCGSHITLMRQLEEADQPLHGRRTARLWIHPFDPRHAARFYPDRSSRDKMLLYGIFGGLAGHLADLDPAADVSENVCRLLLSPSSRLYDEATHFLDAFGPNADVHYAVISAIAQGARTWGEITKRLGRTSGALHPVINWLGEMEVIEREVPVTQPPTSKVSTYRLTDPYLRFWYRFVHPIFTLGRAGMGSSTQLWETQVSPYLDDFMREAFEDICREFVRRTLDLGFAPLRIGRWWTRDPTDEVDIVVTGSDGELFVAECKWGAVDGHDLAKLRRRAALVAGELGTSGRIEFALFSGTGVTDAVVRAAVKRREVRVFGPDDLYG